MVIWEDWNAFMAKWSMNEKARPLEFGTVSWLWELILRTLINGFSLVDQSQAMYVLFYPVFSKKGKGKEMLDIRIRGDENFSIFLSYFYRISPHKTEISGSIDSFGPSPLSIFMLIVVTGGMFGTMAPTCLITWTRLCASDKSDSFHFRVGVGYLSFQLY